ncbi:MAG: PilN domain-containing protein [Gemmatimonadales bacterium]
MIEINLLPGSGKKKAARRQSLNVGAALAGLTGRMKDKFMIAAVAAVVVGAGAVGFLYFTQSAKDASLAERRDQAVHDSTRYANFLRDRYHSEAVRDTLLRQVNLIKGLDEDRFIWAHVLDEVSRALPQYTWLNVLGYAGTPQGNANVVASPKDTLKKKDARPKRLATEVPRDSVTIRLMGRTVDIQALTRFMKDLEASPFIANVQLDRSELAIDQGKEVTQFQLTMGYTRPDTTMIRRVPLSLSVR